MTAAKFEDILTKLEIGPWNWLIFLLCSLWGVFGAMQAVGTAFLSPATDHWCWVPELANWTNTQVWSFALPRITVGGVPHHSQCEMFVRNYSRLVGVAWEDRHQHLPEEEEEEVLLTQPCSSWQYDTQTFRSTLISEWDLVCGRESLRSLIQSIFMFGYFFGSPLGGYFSDRFGRKRIMGGALLVFIIVSVAGSFSPSYQLFLLCRFLMAFSGTVVYQAAYILAVEACTLKQRSIVGILLSVPFALGFMLLPGIAYFVRDWRHLHLAISLPVILLTASTVILPESPRWLLHTRRWREAEKELQRAARWNGRKTSDCSWILSTISQMKAEVEDKDTSSLATKQQEVQSSTRRTARSPCFAKCRGVFGQLLVFVRTPMLRKISLVMYFNWLVCTMVYYGISLNSANFSVDPFLYMFLGGLMELPSYTLIIPFVAKFGRKIPLAGFFILCGMAILVLLLVQDHRSSWWFLGLVMVGKFFITSAYQVIYLYSCELYPTSLRTRGLGVSSMIGRVGSIISPFINDLLGMYHWAIPSTIFGLLSVAAGLLTCILPETNRKALPDTIEDVETWRLPTSRKASIVDDGARKGVEEGDDQRESSWLNPSTTFV
ncbi:organic cation transporter protein isoform X2 [Procambarus clarkii]|uniref:organic cation transporter protein isoform X2 n=1 Tax=Procambarus clarkii TaxID=6728 RepID=UPI001E671C56|nr:organic cation transporter protein-like isoform X2 [Procambarus clarkii]